MSDEDPSDGCTQAETMDKTGVETGHNYAWAATATMSGIWVFMLGATSFCDHQVQHWSEWERDDR